MLLCQGSNTSLWISRCDAFEGNGCAEERQEESLVRRVDVSVSDNWAMLAWSGI